MSTTNPQLLQNFGLNVDGSAVLANTCRVKKMGEILRELRIEKGLTQAQAGEKAGCDGETIYRFEHMDAPPEKGDTYRMIVEAYGYSIEEVNAMWRTKKGNISLPTGAGTASESEPDAAGDAMRGIIRMFKSLPEDERVAVYAALATYLPNSAATGSARTPGGSSKAG